jgi:hypothetical protein
MRFEGEPVYLPSDVAFGGSHPLESSEGTLRPDITTNTLMEANHSEEAQTFRDEFDENRRNNSLILDWECSDARNPRLLPTESFYFHTVANGGDPRKLKNALNSEVIKAATVVAHEPICGGRAAKGKQVSEGIHNPQTIGLSGFISREIDHPSVLQAGRQARKMAELVDDGINKDVAAMVRNHETGELKILAIFNKNGGEAITNIPEELFYGHVPVNPQLDFLLPYLDESQLPEFWIDYLQRHEDKRKDMLRQYPDFPQQNRDHNPRGLALKTDLRAAEIWIPGIAKPGSLFRLTTPRDRIQPINGEKTTVLNPHELRLAWEQAEYVITHAIENRGKPEGAFRDTDTFIIATPQYGISQRIAFEFAQLPFAGEWLADERNKVLVAQNNAGVLHRIGEMKFNFRDETIISFEERNAVAA